jgi:hypothetical protein
MSGNLSQVISLFVVIDLPIDKFIFVGGNCKKIPGLVHLSNFVAEVGNFKYQSKIIEININY